MVPANGREPHGGRSGRPAPIGRGPGTRDPTVHRRALGAPSRAGSDGPRADPRHSRGRLGCVGRRLQPPRPPPSNLLPLMGWWALVTIRACAGIARAVTRPSSARRGRRLRGLDHPWPLPAARERQRRPCRAGPLRRHPVRPRRRPGVPQRLAGQAPAGHGPGLLAGPLLFIGALPSLKGPVATAGRSGLAAAGTAPRPTGGNATTPTTRLTASGLDPPRSERRARCRGQHRPERGGGRSGRRPNRVGRDRPVLESGDVAPTFS